MQKILLLLVVSFFVGKNCEAQNLVPNPSFEDYTICPLFDSQISLSNSWIGFSADYFNSCDTSNFVSVPNNFFGFQNASNGNAYAGIYCFHTANNNYREFIQCHLNSALVQEQKYYVSIKISLADLSNCATNNLGAYFTTLPLNDSIPPTINNNPLIHPTSIISDTSNWSIVSGIFVADSSYNYIVIGNCLTDSLTNVIGDFSCSAYYYIDDVCVSPDSLACDLNPEGIYNLKESKASINLYPNPATEQLIIDNGQWIINEIEISDALGRVQSCEFKVQRPSTQIDIHSLPSGIYFIKVYFADGSMEVRRFVKE